MTAPQPMAKGRGGKAPVVEIRETDDEVVTITDWGWIRTEYHRAKKSFAISDLDDPAPPHTAEGQGR